MLFSENAGAYRMNVAQQALVLTLRGTVESSPHRPSPIGPADDPRTPVLLPLPDNAALAQLCLAQRGLLAADAVVVCVDRQLRDAIRRAGHPCTVLTATEVFGRQPLKLTVVATGLRDGPMLCALSRAHGTLALAFRANRPPPMLARVHKQLVHLIPQNCAYVTWEAPARRPQAATPADALKARINALPTRSITALYLDLAPKGPMATTQAALERGAVALDWPAPPHVRARHVVGGPLLRRPLGRELAQIAGLAVELVAAREVCFMDPPTPVILPPDAYARYCAAVPCSSRAFMVAWTGSEHLHRQRHTRAGWLANFARWSDVGDGVKREMAAALADRAPPHLVLPAEALGGAVRDRVEWAVARHCDSDAVVIPERAWWVLGALDYVCAAMRVATVDVLLRACGDAFAPPAPRLFQRAGGRLRHVLSTLGARSVELQRRVVHKGFVGSADVIVNGDTVLELKLSGRNAHSFEFRSQWALQTAIYTKALGMRRGHLFNVNTNSWLELQFPANLDH